MSHVQNEDPTSDEDLVMLAQMRVASQKAAALEDEPEQPGSEEHDSDDADEDMDAADVAASKYLRGSKANKAGRRKARRAAAAAAPAGDASALADSASVAGPSRSQEAKHERKQKQQKQQSAYGATAAGASGGGGGIADGQLSVRDEELVKHALTQMSFLKQESVCTFVIQKGANPDPQAHPVGLGPSCAEGNAHHCCFQAHWQLTTHFMGLPTLH